LAQEAVGEKVCWNFSGNADNKTKIYKLSIMTLTLLLFFGALGKSSLE
jgi:hypothetical protein